MTKTAESTVKREEKHKEAKKQSPKEGSKPPKTHETGCRES
jgi:hypothetical protein